MFRTLSESASDLECALRVFRDQLAAETEHRRSCSELATKHDLNQFVKTIMSAISDFAAKVTAHNDKIDNAVDGLTADVANLAEQITALQTSSGVITPEDQALLDGIEARSEAIAEKLGALDALTPPKAPAA